MKKLPMLAVLGGLAALALSTAVLADTTSVTFEPPTYTTGSPNGQDGWTKTGAYDAAIVTNVSAPASFQLQSLRISDAVTSGSFGDQTFAKPLNDSVGETDASSAGFTVGTLYPHFEMKFDIASTQTTQQPGMHVSISPDRGDGSRMSYLRIEDGSAGFDVFFDDVQGTSNPANFVETEIATGLNRTTPHTIKLTLDTPLGDSNDVVMVYIDGVLKQTGASWENYYWYDSESSAEQTPRIVKTVLFRESGTANSLDAGKGFLIDNLSTVAGPSPTPTSKDQCTNSGWKTFANPSFSNQGQCISSIVSHNNSNPGNQNHGRPN